MLDDEVAGVEALGVGVGLGVLQETDEELGGLDGPAGLGDTECLACCSGLLVFVLWKVAIRVIDNCDKQNMPITQIADN